MWCDVMWHDLNCIASHCTALHCIASHCIALPLILSYGRFPQCHAHYIWITVQPQTIYPVFTHLSSIVASLCVELRSIERRHADSVASLKQVHLDELQAVRYTLSIIVRCNVLHFFCPDLSGPTFPTLPSLFTLPCITCSADLTLDPIPSILS